jgi:hypothetical protein
MVRNASRGFSALFFGGTVLVTAVALLAAPAGCGDDSGSAGTGGGNGSTSGSGGSGEETPSCEKMCADVMKNCTGDQQVYITEDVCLAVCAEFPLGRVSDTSGNTVGCRTYHAGASKDQPEVHCPHAGPGGDGYCGENCDGYCTLALATCPDEFTDEADCQDACAAFPKHAPFSINQSTGDTIECRLYHVSVATTDADTHCPHVGVNPAPGTCVGVPPP